MSVFAGAALAASLGLGSPAAAGTAGAATGSMTVDGAAAKLAFATSGITENLFDDAKRDTVVVVSDRPLADVRPDDAVELHLLARQGKLAALALRLDGAKLVNVAVHGAGQGDMVLLPGAWFVWQPHGAAGGRLTLAKRESDGHTYACDVEFTAAPAAPARAAVAEPEPAAAAPTPTLPPASTSSIAPAAMAGMLVAAMMAKDEAQALQLVASGADPNLRDQYGVPMLNWAVMTCMPRVVKALVDRGADLKYERAPGLTILTEAGACPEAAKILRAAGAR